MLLLQLVCYLSAVSLCQQQAHRARLCAAECGREEKAQTSQLRALLNTSEFNFQAGPARLPSNSASIMAWMPAHKLCWSMKVTAEAAAEEPDLVACSAFGELMTAECASE